MSRHVMQQALDSIGSAYREHFVNCHGNTKNELQAAANAIRAELAKPAAVPDGWVMVPREPTPEMRTEIMSAINHEHMVKNYKAMLAAAPQPPAPAVSPVDVEAVRGTIFRMKDNHKLRESRCKPDPLISIWANELARAIGDEK